MAIEGWPDDPLRAGNINRTAYHKFQGMSVGRARFFPRADKLRFQRPMQLVLPPTQAGSGYELFHQFRLHLPPEEYEINRLVVTLYVTVSGPGAQFRARIEGGVTDGLWTDVSELGLIYVSSVCRITSSEFGAMRNVILEHQGGGVTYVAENESLIWLASDESDEWPVAAP